MNIENNKYVDKITYNIKIRKKKRKETEMKTKKRI